MATTETVGAPPATDPVTGLAPQPAGYRRYALGLLLAIYIINFFDRQVINILAEPIKRDLNLSDTQIGLMGGLAFALFYTVLGLPIARLAERKNRAVIIGTAVAVWSAMTAVCGLAQNFAQLVAARIGVGVGEAGCSPPAHSLIADYVPREKRASALAFYATGTPLGALLGMAVGGLIADAFGWRTAFLVAGLPGLIFAVLAFTTLREPRKQLSAEFKRTQAAQPNFGATLKLLSNKPTFWFMAFATALKIFILYGHAPFTASFFLRNHTEEVAGLAQRFGAAFGYNMQSIGFLGVVLGLITGLAGTSGALIGGWVADKFGARDLRWYMLPSAIAGLICVPLMLATYLVESAALALFLMVISGVLASLSSGPVYGTAQSVVPPQMRATTAAILLLIMNLIGLGLGPLTVGAMSDFFAGSLLTDGGLSADGCRVAASGLTQAAQAACAEASATGVRWALLASSVVGIPSAFLFWMASRTIREDRMS